MSHDAANISNLANNELYLELKHEFDEYKKEQSKSYAQLEHQLDHARAAVSYAFRVIRIEALVLLQESDAKVTLAKAHSENKYLAERYRSTSEDLQSSTVSYDHLRKKIDDYSSLVIQQQKTIDELSSRRSEVFPHNSIKYRILTTLHFSWRQ